MRVLLDENLPHDLIAELAGHDVSSVQGLGWAGVKNGELLRRAAGQTDALLTMDRKLEYQHDISVLPFGLIVVRAHSNRIKDLRPLVGEIHSARPARHDPARRQVALRHATQIMKDLPAAIAKDTPRTGPSPGRRRRRTAGEAPGRGRPRR